MKKESLYDSQLFTEAKWQLKIHTFTTQFQNDDSTQQSRMTKFINEKIDFYTFDKIQLNMLKNRI